MRVRGLIHTPRRSRTVNRYAAGIDQHRGCRLLPQLLEQLQTGLQIDFITLSVMLLRSATGYAHQVKDHIDTVCQYPS